MTPDRAKQIRTQMRKALGQVAQRLALIPEKEDNRYPPEHIVERQQQRAELIREWTTIEARYVAELQAWADEARQEAERLRSSDPVGTPEQESRRVSENLEIANLAAPFIGQSPVMARNRLHGEAKRLLALDLPDQARVYLEAARRAGVEDGRLDQALEDAYDRTVPARRQAKGILTVVQDQQDTFDLDRYSARIAHGVGSQGRASTAAKLVHARRGEPTPAGLVGGAQAEANLHRSAADAGTAE